MMNRDLDVWFNGLELEALARMFSWPSGKDANEFIDDCDEYWWNLTPEEKEDFYLRYA